MRVTGLLTLLVLLAMPIAAEPEPRLERRGESLHLVQLPPVLADEEVKRQLSTGLTTTFVFRARGRSVSGRTLEGAARVEIRFEPWDEVYFLQALGRDGRQIRDKLDSPDALARRWRDLDLMLTPIGSKVGDGTWRLELDIIPFSRGEQRDTQRWFSESMDRDAGAEQTARASDERSEALEEVFNLLLATSIGRRAILTYDWQLEAVPGVIDP